MAYPHAHLLLFATMLAVAAYCDVFLRKIPNWVTVAIAASGLVYCLMEGGARTAALGLAAGIAIGLLFTPLWMARAMGGGDLKLAAACAVWIGLSRAPRYVLASCIAGGLIAIVCYAISSAEGRRSVRANIYGLHAPSWPKAAATAGGPLLVPYGAAFAVGALWAMLAG